MINFKKLAEEVGTENMVFMVPCGRLHHVFGIGYTTLDDERDVVECRVDESRYPVADGYKITLKPVSEKYATESYYQMDLLSLMREYPDSYYMKK